MGLQIPNYLVEITNLDQRGGIANPHQRGYTNGSITFSSAVERDNKLND